MNLDRHAVNRWISVVTALFLFALSGLGWAADLPFAKPEKVGMSSERLDLIGPALRTDIEKGKIPGAVVLIARQGKVVYFESFGMRKKDSGAPMTKDAIFRIYSMTKPIVTVAALKLSEEGRLFLADPVSKYIPELGKLKVCIETADPATDKVACNNVPSVRDMTIQDLMRHSSGLTYGFFGKSEVKTMYKTTTVESPDQTLPEMITKLSKLPLAYQPGTKWDYSRSTDVLGRVIEIASGMSLDRYIEENITKPLGMQDSGFYVKPDKLNRLAEPQKPGLSDVTKPPKLLSGGGGMVASTMDYAVFAQMLQNGGQLNGTRILGPKTIEYMTSDHLGNVVGPGPIYLPGAGYGFGLGVAVRLQNGVAAYPGTAGDYFWDGLAGTYFWIDPKEQLITVFMIQEPSQRLYYRSLLRSMVYQAIIK
jgi:CubicO group peptidase (beta-lactamase class C family)